MYGSARCVLNANDTLMRLHSGIAHRESTANVAPFV